MEVVRGEARFIDTDALEVDGEEMSFHHALVATGARPALPPVPGLAEAEPLTNETVWDLEKLPEKLVVLRGGSTGCELGQAFARLGARVTIVEAEHRLLPREDPDAAALVHAALERDGEEVLVGHRAVAVRRWGHGENGEGDGAGDIVVDDGSGERAVGYGALLVAVGGEPRTDGIGLEWGGVALDERGVCRRGCPPGDVEPAGLGRG